MRPSAATQNGHVQLPNEVLARQQELPRCQGVAKTAPHNARRCGRAKMREGLKDGGSSDRARDRHAATTAEDVVGLAGRGLHMLGNRGGVVRVPVRADDYQLAEVQHTGPAEPGRLAKTSNNVDLLRVFLWWRP